VKDFLYFSPRSWFDFVVGCSFRLRASFKYQIGFLFLAKLDFIFLLGKEKCRVVA
jgi:hypothetical protein